MRPSRPLLPSLILATAACGTAPPVAAQTAPPAPPDRPLIAEELKDDAAIARAVRAHYTKYEHKVPMRDGVRLFTTVYVPKDALVDPGAGRTYPILLQRTPYSVTPYGVDNYPGPATRRSLQRLAPSVHFIREGYIFVQQDVRGRLMSEGVFVDVRPRNASGVDEATDAFDTVDWLVENVPANNGHVGVWGISYPGFYAAQAGIDAHPAVKAISPQAPVTEWFIGDDFHHNGAFMLADAFGFYSGFGRPRPEPTKKMTWEFEYGTGDAYEFFLRLGPVANADKVHLKGGIPFWNDLMAHGTRDAFWQARDPRPHYRKVKPAVLTVGGWFDAEDLYGALETYRAFETQSPGAENTLVMGPWSHGGWARDDGDVHGDVHFGAKTALFYREHIELPFFRRHLRGAPVPRAPEAWIFETGTHRWVRYPAWPPPASKPATLYLQAQGGLAAASPAPPPGDAGFDAYLSDPHKPVPYSPRHGEDIDKRYMSEDQRFAARRPDVLVYETAELTEDVTLAGPLEATLWVSTTGTDADFVVKLIDVYPGDVADPEPNPVGVRLAGYQQLVRGEVMRGKFRDSFEVPKAFTPGEPTKVVLRLPDVSHSFRTGHRIMVQIQSSWFPLVDRNPQTFTDIYAAKAEDFRAATHQIHRSAARPSALTVRLLGGALP